MVTDKAYACRRLSLALFSGIPRREFLGNSRTASRLDTAPGSGVILPHPCQRQGGEGILFWINFRWINLMSSSEGSKSESSGEAIGGSFESAAGDAGLQRRYSSRFWYSWWRPRQSSSFML